MAKKEKAIKTKGFGVMPVYFTAISAILGAILFLRLGYATGTLGFWGVFGVVLLGHLITVPTALAISELATNTRVEGGGEYFIISRSFGLKIGSTIGIALFLSQTISIAFYSIAFAESFYPLYEWWLAHFGWELPRQAISIPALLILAWLILFKGTGSGMKMLYIVNGILIFSLGMFFLGKPLSVEDAEGAVMAIDNFGLRNPDMFFIVFAICFPAFTGMTAGVGLSGDLRNPSKSIPLGTILATVTGFVVYILVAWKLSVSAPQGELSADQMIMARIALFGAVVIPIGLAASTASSALGSMLVAPRTLQAIARDKTFPFRKMNVLLARGRGENNEPFNASILSFAIAFVVVLLGDVNSVAQVISMFFLITYGTLCLCSFLNHFGSPPSYRPKFRSKWFISLFGFIMSVWVMFMISPLYTVISYIFIALLYLLIAHYNKDKTGIENIFRGALFQLNRQLQVYMQKHQSNMDKEEWRPAVVCISSHSFEREKVLELMKWISYQHGFGTYFHFIQAYYNSQTHNECKDILAKLVASQKEKGSTLYLDTMISPSYTSAIAQIIQTPSISGMENNMVVFEYDKHYPEELQRILENVNLVKSGGFDVGIFAGSDRPLGNGDGIHVWIHDADDKNTNFMILLGYIILAHPHWKRSHIKIFIASPLGGSEAVERELHERITAGRLPITLTNIEIVTPSEGQTFSQMAVEHSAGAALTVIGFDDEIVEHAAHAYFSLFDDIGDILFVNASEPKEIT